ncbi:mCG147959 [Mus musculus]|nr:mCG147959 [Mus musculus]
MSPRCKLVLAYSKALHFSHVPWARGPSGHSVSLHPPRAQQAGTALTESPKWILRHSGFLYTYLLYLGILSPPPTGDSGKERLTGQRRMWTCLEIIL